MLSSRDGTTIEDNTSLDDVIATGVGETKTPAIPIMRIHSGSLHAHAIRFPPGSDLVASLVYAAKQALLTSSSNNSDGACIVLTAVGSLSQCTLRMASAPMLPKTNQQQQQQQSSQDLESQSGLSSSQFDRTMYQQHVRTWNENLEIVSLVGTFGLVLQQQNNDNDDDIISSNDTTTVSKHLHMSISDANGNCYGGHLVGGTILTTLELVLGTIGNGVQFNRIHDELTGYQELSVTSTSNATSRNP